MDYWVGVASPIPLVLFCYVFKEISQDLRTSAATRRSKGPKDFVYQQRDNERCPKSTAGVFVTPTLHIKAWTCGFMAGFETTLKLRWYFAPRVYIQHESTHNETVEKGRQGFCQNLSKLVLVFFLFVWGFFDNVTVCKVHISLCIYVCASYKIRDPVQHKPAGSLNKAFALPSDVCWGLWGFPFVHCGRDTKEAAFKRSKPTSEFVLQYELLWDYSWKETTNPKPINNHMSVPFLLSWDNANSIGHQSFNYSPHDKLCWYCACSQCFLPLMYAGAHAQYISMRTWSPPARQQKLSLQNGQMLHEAGELKNGRPQLNNESDKAGTEGLCLTSILSFPEAQRGGGAVCTVVRLCRAICSLWHMCERPIMHLCIASACSHRPCQGKIQSSLSIDTFGSVWPI